MIVGYIDDHKQEYGVEPIWRVLTAHGCKIAPSTYYDVCARRRQPCKRQLGFGRNCAISAPSAASGAT
ncbi:hypothetical protein GCM10027068_39960 [Prescottella soli]|uniref:hypothetical protein n=1 Tax=Prescottella soli TaxID=1543852 RepID=UPI0038BB816E